MHTRNHYSKSKNHLKKNKKKTKQKKKQGVNETKSFQAADSKEESDLSFAITSQINASFETCYFSYVSSSVKKLFM